MRRSSRDRLIISLLGLSAVVVGCSRLTSIDWGLIPPATGGTGVGATDAGGAAPGEQSGGAPDVTPVGGVAGETSGGEGGAGGEMPNVSGGTGGGGGVSGGGSGGMSGSGGASGSGGGGGVSGGGSGGTAGTAGTEGSGGDRNEPSICSGMTGPLTNAMVLFASPAKPNAVRGGRDGLDADCAAERIKQGLAQTTTHAFITVDGGDYLAIWGTAMRFPDLPKTQRIVGPTGIQLAASWEDLIQGRIEQSLICARVLPSNAYWWLSGSHDVGMSIVGSSTTIYGQYAVAGDTCNGWTVGVATGASFARPGAAEFADTRMLAAAVEKTRGVTLLPCDSTSLAPALCLAYTP